MTFVDNDNSDLTIRLFDTRLTGGPFFDNSVEINIASFGFNTTRILGSTSPFVTGSPVQTVINNSELPAKIGVQIVRDTTSDTNAVVNFFLNDVIFGTIGGIAWGSLLDSRYTLCGTRIDISSVTTGTGQFSIVDDFESDFSII